MKLSFPRKRVLFGTVLLTVAIVLGFVYRLYMYPFGDRGCALRCMHGALLAFAGEHHGHFPSSEKGPLDALQKLYPEYIPSGSELAGISGNIGALIKALHNRSAIDESLTSWVYIQGLSQNDDPRLAVLWERRPGLYASGKRNFFGGRAVLLISGDITNVPLAEWSNFAKQQEQLLKQLETYGTVTKRVSK